jgi:hypothetical protein
VGKDESSNFVDTKPDVVGSNPTERDSVLVRSNYN